MFILDDLLIVDGWHNTHEYQLGFINHFTQSFLFTPGLYEIDWLYYQLIGVGIFPYWLNWQIFTTENKNEKYKKYSKCDNFNKRAIEKN